MKMKPYIFLAVLFVVLFFILGIRYGQKVEQANKTINYYLSLPPTKPIEPTRSLEYKTYVHKTCGIAFLYPLWLTKEKETTVSAEFSEKNKTMISFTCGKNTNPSPSTASGMILLQKKNQTGTKTVFFIVDQQIAPLIEKSVEFITPTP